MKIPKSHFSEYFKRSVVYLVKTKLAVFIISIIEFVDLCTNMVDLTYQIFYYGKEYNYKNIKLSKILLAASPYQYYFNFISSENTNSTFTRNYVFIIVYAAFFIWYLTYFLSIRNCDLDAMTKFNKLIQKISINFFDFVLFRIIPIYAFDLFSREIMKICSKEIASDGYLDYIILFLALFFLGALLILHILYYSKISVWTNFRIIESYFAYYPYDSFFSAKCDMIFCTLKCIISLEKNYVFYNKGKVDYIAEFLVVFLLISFIGYAFYLIYLFFFSYQILYFFMTGFNMLRTFFIVFMFESVVTRILLHKNKDYKSFLVYEFIYLLFDCYIIFGEFYTYVLSKAIKSQNYLAVCWFIQANKIDIQQFIIEWIANHKTVCFDKNCEICEELIKGHIALDEDENNDLKDDNDNEKEVLNKNNYNANSNNNAHNKNNQNKIKKDDMNMNLIMKIYPPYQFNLKLINLSMKIKKSFGADDLIRLDFLYLTVLFLSNRNVEYRLFSKICNLIIQYYSNINVSVTLLLIFEIIRKSNLDLIKGYDLIKKNEDLRNSLKEYITEYENFIHFGAKSPENYLYISGKFREFKQLTKSIHELFRKNIECNYQLLIMRYAYETLLHIKFKNMVPFDLGFFTDFLDYHYSKDKLFLVKYIIDRDTFTIIKGSKEVLKFQDNSLESIFPDYLRETGLELFKNQLENVEKNDQKPLFSFVIKDLYHNESFGFVDSFKMKYFVYPTNMINELLLQANFINNFTNIMIFEELEGEQILFSFSAQLYKYFGLTPNMVYILKKAGMIINFDVLFPKKKSKKNKKERKNQNQNQEKADDNSFQFEYKTYLPFYQKLLECDGLNDVSNYSQLKDKLSEISMMAQEQKELFFNIQPKELFENYGVKYSIYHIKEQKKKKKGYQNALDKKMSAKLGSLTESEISEEDRTNSEDFDEKYEGKGLNISMPTMSSASLSRTSTSVKTTNVKGKKDEKAEEKSKRQEKVNRYTIIILLFGLFLVVVSIVFLYLEVNENNKFKELFQLFQTFKIFKRGIESSPLSLLSNYCYYSKTLEPYNNCTNHTKCIEGQNCIVNITCVTINEGNQQPCLNFYKEYSENLTKKYPSFKNFPNAALYQLIQEEIKYKYDDIIKTFNDYQKAIFNLDSGVINKISDLTAFSYSITVDGNIVTLVKTDMNFISLCREYNNYITTLLDNDAYMKEIFSLVAFNNREGNNEIESLSRMTFVSEYLKSFSQTRKIMLLMLMAYPSIHIGLLESSSIMQEEFHSSLNRIEILLVVFFILQIILNSILIVIFMMFLYVYVKMVKYNILTANKLFSDRAFLELQDRRIEQMKILSNLYQESPLKISEKIDSIDDYYRRKTGDLDKKKNKTIENGHGEEKEGDNLSEISSQKKLNKKEIVKTSTNMNESLKTLGSLTGLDKNPTNDKTEKKGDKNGIADDENVPPLTSLSQMNNISDRVFNKITIGYKFILFISLSIYMLYCVIFFVVVLLGCKRLGYLVNYCEVNNEIDGYLFDNFNTLLYMYITNSTSKFYGQIIHNKQNIDYLNEGINDFYAAIQDKETIELEHKNMFPAIYDIINLDCSQGMIEDDYFESATEILNVDYNDYFKVICSAFPVATTGNDNTMLFEVLYMIDQLYHRFENLDFSLMFNQMHNSVLFDCYTLVLTLNRVIRNYFNNIIFIKEVNEQFNYFSTLIIIYLVFNMVLEIIVFLILNMGIIYQIKFNNKLMLDFISSLKF